MPAYLEAWKQSGAQLLPLEGDRVTVGKAGTNSVAIDADSLVSRLHAVLERYPSGWCVRDLGSRNGTYVNGERITAERALRPGDEIRVGGTRLVFRSDDPGAGGTSVTHAAQPPPELTRRERQALLALCRPVLTGSLLNEPATIREIASELVVTESAVKKHLLNLYDKFSLHEPEDRRRGRLASEAIRRGAVTLADARGSE